MFVFRANGAEAAEPTMSCVAKVMLLVTVEDYSFASSGNLRRLPELAKL